MFLKRIILKNFKSFRGKTILDFPCLITAVIGPNGSGKSNIVDAIRWALGEQSFKNIRVEKGQDLIFAGSKNDTTAAVCEVELIFDNQKRLFNTDFSEVSILRRIDKSGENSYFLNHKPCRLKDIIDLTASAKIGLKGFSIINQGSVENILLVSPQERRIMLEEILGLKNIELKKEEAKRKLEETNINLDKTLALEQEILPHLRTLKRQVTRWEKREKIEEDLIITEKKYFANLYHQVLESNIFPDKKLDSLNQEIAALNQKIKNKEEELLVSKGEANGGLESKIQKITQEIINLQNKKSELLHELGHQEVATGLALSGKELEKQIIIIKEKLEKLLTIEDIALIHHQLKEIIAEFKTIFVDNARDNRPQVENIENQLASLEEELSNKNLLLKQEEEELNTKNRNFRAIFEEINELRRQKEDLLKEEQRQELLLEKYKLHLEDLKRRIEEAGLDFIAIKQYYEDNKSQILLAPEDLLSLEKQVLRLRRDMAEIGIEDANVIKEYEEISKRHNFLQQQIADLKKGSQDLKILIQQLTKEIEKSFEKSLSDINKDFNRYFRLMFAGGSAKIEQIKKSKSLVNNENQEEGEDTDTREEDVNQESYWGVDIKIDIPKTELKSLEMLSGGEKTLVAISLLFAIVNQSDPPLVVVDEIDAALDEDNSQRFSQILKELCKNTQFIIITHNRMTMSVAEVIYGVTIGEENSSQLLSIKLEDSDKILQKS
ncbi:MAG: AAA family ATPase [Parcubacteria group bacterium]|nr:AAA family ATPase [Parcubacteria group bacterium]